MKSLIFYAKIFLITTFSLLCVFQNLSSIAQEKSEYFDENFLRYENFTYNMNFKTVQLHRLGWENSYPMIQLDNPEDKLLLSFDEMASQPRDVAYTFIHCNANWEPSSLNKLEFQTGLNEDVIRDYTFSRSPRQRYIHYNLSFPNERIQITKSGNYIIKAYDLNTNEILITMRFYVVEQGVSVNMVVKPAVQARYRFTHHQVDFSIQIGSYDMTNPYTDLKVTLMQNQRWDNAIQDLKPRFSTNVMLNYNYDDRNLFPAGNEFRFFDTRDLRYNPINTMRTDLVNDTFNITLNPDPVRSIGQYFQYPDINGRYLIHRFDPWDESTVDSDYALVHFFLPYPNPLAHGELYLMGELVNWQIKEKSKMEYSEKRRGYQKTLFLKQGYYNYMYVMVSDDSKGGDKTFIEGSHMEAENEYTVFVYHKQIGDIYDRLIAVQSTRFPQR